MSNDPPPYAPLLPYPTSGVPDALRDNVNLNEYYQVSNECLYLQHTQIFSLSFPQQQCIKKYKIVIILIYIDIQTNPL